MFRKMKNIDTAFRHVRVFTLVVIGACTLISTYALHQSAQAVSRIQAKIYILANGKALEAYAAERKDNVGVEARDHVKTFHHYFFTLDPDDKVIRENIGKALYLADQSAKHTYDNLKENGFYAGLISGNISQTITIDSVQIDVETYPYRFRCYGMQHIVRPMSLTTRSLVTGGELRSISRSDNNPHGFLIERWHTIENKELKTENRR